jgi:hypothetical protein
MKMNKQNPPINQPYPIICVIPNTAIMGGLAGATTTQIEYFGPGGLHGYWNATIQNVNELYVLTGQSDINRVGKWTFRPYIVKGGRPWRGDSYTEKFVA